jgi:hypothetical protein
VTVGQGIEGVVNIPTVSVTICAPGTTTCQTIDNVQVDTESFGLRLVGTAASTVLGSLPQQSANGAPVAECTQFADGFTWGTVRVADVKIGGEAASAVPIQIIGDLPSSSAPAGCASGTDESTVAQLGANGILGIGVAPTDCGASCATNVAASNYYACPSGGSCTATTLPIAQQVTNPVTKFAGDNNGVILTMPAVGDSGAASVSGTLTFGIGTQSNNTFAATQKFATNASGDVNGTFNGASTIAFFDSGSNAYFFDDPSITRCTGQAAAFFCPPSPTSRTITVANFNGSVSGAPGGLAIGMNVANGNTLFANGNFAFNNLAGSLGQTTFVDLGMPFFYGRSVYYGYDQTAVGGPSPYVAF